MSWAKLCGSFCFHRKVLEADQRTRQRASGAFARMISWSAENMTGGALSPSIALTIAKDPKVLEALVAAGLLERRDGGYALHDFGDYNPTGEQLAARRDQIRRTRAQAGRRGAAARWGHGKPQGKSNGKTDDNPDGKPDGNLPSATMANDGKPHGKKMAPSPSPSPSPPSVVKRALPCAADAASGPPQGPRDGADARPPDAMSAKEQVLRTFVACFRAKKHVEPMALFDVDHAKAFELAVRFGEGEACAIVRRAFEHDFVVHENATLRYIASKADTFRGAAAPKKARGPSDKQLVVGDEPWLKEHLR